MKETIKRVDYVKLTVFLLLSLTAVLGFNLIEYRRFLGGNIKSGLILVLFVLTLTLFCYFFCAYLSELIFVEREETLLSSSEAKRLFFVIAIIDILVLIIHYPGLGSWDTWYQISDYFNGTTTYVYNEGGGAIITSALNDHHPVFTTVLFSEFAKLGRALGDEVRGVFLYQVLQILLFSYAFVRVISFIEYKSRIQKTLVEVFYIINPFLTYYAISMVKDALYSVLFLLYFVSFLNILIEKDSKEDRILFCISSLFMPLTKKTGIYIVLFSNLCLFLWSITRKTGKKKKSMILMNIAVPSFIMLVLLPKVLFPAFNVFSGGKQEVIATLLQQSARVQIDHPNYYSEEEKELLNKVFDFDNVRDLYDYGITDPVKNTYKLASVTDNQLHEYYRLWLKTGLDHPMTYLRATAGTCAGFFSPTKKLTVYTNNVRYELTNNSFVRPFRIAYRKLYYYLYSLPGISVLLTIVLYSWWIPCISFSYMIKKRGVITLVAFSPVIITLLTLIVSPYSFGRYALPLVMAAPLLALLHNKDPLEVKGDVEKKTQ